MGHKVLLVDDSETIRSVISKIIKLTGIAVDEINLASNGLEALDLMRKKQIDLVITDINMPIMNGMEMIEKMKAQPSLSIIPIIVISTEGSATRIDSLKAGGIKAYLRKPFTPEQLRDAINSVMGK